MLKFLAFIKCFLLFLTFSNVTGTKNDDQISCELFTCDFENGNLCSYQNDDDRLIRKPSMKWRVFRGRDRMHHLKYKFSTKSTSYTAVYLSKDEKAILSTRTEKVPENWRLKEERVIKFRYYETAPGVRLKGCCDSGTISCPFLPERRTGRSTYRWKMASFSCKAGTKKILFVASNSDSTKAGIRLDDVRMFYPSDYHTPKWKANKDVCVVAKTELNRKKIINAETKIILPSRLPNYFSTFHPTWTIKSTTLATDPTPVSPTTATTEFSELFTTPIAESTMTTSVFNVGPPAERPNLGDDFNSTMVDDVKEKRILIIASPEADDQNSIIIDREKAIDLLNKMAKAEEAFVNETTFGLPTLFPNKDGSVEFMVDDENDFFNVIILQKNSQGDLPNND